MLGFINKILGLDKNGELSSYISEGAFLVDVRTSAEFRGGSVAGAMNIPLDRLESQLHKLPKDSKIVVFCRSGMRSAQAKRLLDNKGYTQVINGGTWSKVSNVKGR
ncbi:sulfurtransferase [Myroides marinus]|uniref:Sulfurtransferase n=1 Tax=Myroides marinus TaxID=703342 RepID=A0A164AMD3_9FLAO|nr:rhodanese-like domain-containing protein [Myroides marinus]KZE84208.1 sulfurtransferase [Myroides marinus]